MQAGVNLSQDILDRPLASGAATGGAWEEDLALRAVHASRAARDGDGVATAREQAHAALQHAACAVRLQYQQEIDDMVAATECNAAPVVATGVHISYMRIMHTCMNTL